MPDVALTRPASGAVRNECLLCEPPSLRGFVMMAWAETDVVPHPHYSNMFAIVTDGRFTPSLRRPRGGSCLCNSEGILDNVTGASRRGLWVWAVDSGWAGLPMLQLSERQGR